MIDYITFSDADALQTKAEGCLINVNRSKAVCCTIRVNMPSFDVKVLIEVWFCLE